MIRIGDARSSSRAASPGRVIAAGVAGFTAGVVAAAFTTRVAAGISITRLRGTGTTFGFEASGAIWTVIRIAATEAASRGTCVRVVGTLLISAGASLSSSELPSGNQES